MLLHAAAGASDDVAFATGRPLRLRWRGPLQAAAVLLILAGGALWLRSARRPREVSGLHPAGPTEPTEATHGAVAPGWDVDSPRDHGQRVRPSIPCLESSTVRRPGENDPA
jgi:hypothetical protein